VLDTNARRRWCHWEAPAKGMRNPGRALVIRDRVLGTYLRADSAARPARIGLFVASRAYPQATRFLQQVHWPQWRGCCRASTGRALLALALGGKVWNRSAD